MLGLQREGVTGLRAVETEPFVGCETVTTAERVDKIEPEEEP